MVSNKYILSRTYVILRHEYSKKIIAVIKKNHYVVAECEQNYT